MKNNITASVLRVVVGARLRQHGLGYLWKDERTWQEIGDAVLSALSQKFAIVEKETYNRLVRESHELQAIRDRVAEFEKLRVFKPTNGSRQGEYTRWAEENMKEKKQ